MITDTLENFKLYTRISDRIATALIYLLTTDLEALKPGKYIVEEDEIFAQVSEYSTKLVDEVKWEAHSKFTDIQVIIKGEEKMGFAPLEKMKITEAYDPDKDIEFLTGTGDYLTARPGSFTIFFPHDAHQPGVAIHESCSVKKVVVKVKV